MDTPKYILMIVIDDLRPELACYGRTALQTPNIDRLAAAGITYTRAYCNFPQCMPSRAGVMTGKRPGAFLKWSNQLLAPGEVTLPAYMRKQGYRTLSTGKVYHEPLDDAFNWDELFLDTARTCPDGGMEQSFHDYQLPENRALTEKKFTLSWEEWNQHPDCLPPLFELSDAPDGQFVDHRVASRAIERLEHHVRNAPDQKLFLAAGFFRPHLPWIAPRWAWDLYDRKGIDIADNPYFPEGGIGKNDLVDMRHYFDAEIVAKFSDIGRFRDDDFPVLSEAKQRELIHAYRASVSFMDAQVGRLLDSLERLGIAGETAIVLWGDNGYHLGEHKLWAKITDFEESIRVPLILNLPGATRGATHEGLVELVDIFPTLASLTHGRLPGQLEGSPLPLDTAQPGKSAVFSCSMYGRTMVTDRYRLTHYPQAESPDFKGNTGIIPGRGAWEVFDRRCDPAENRNIVHEVAHRPAVAAMKEQLQSVYPTAGQ